MQKAKLGTCIVCQREFLNHDYDESINICTQCKSKSDDCRQCQGYLNVENQCEYCNYG